MHLGVRQQQLAALSASSWSADLPAAEVQDVDVELSWSPVAAEPTAGSSLEAFQETKECGRRDRSLDHHNGVEIRRLLPQTYGSRRVERGARQDSKVGLNKLAERV
jgi:hypothetical protein